MKWLRWIMQMVITPHKSCRLPRTPVPGEDPVRRELRDQVHSYRDIATKAVAESRNAIKVSDRNRRVAEEAISVLEQTKRDEDEGKKDAGPD
jgi:hypothetical protein